jgi:hypothetical protein
MSARRAALLLLLCACPNPGIDLDAQYACTTNDQCGTEDYECCLGLCRRVGTFDENICFPPPDAGGDAGSPDSGVNDSGTPDSGTPDSGTPDAGMPDSGSPDAGGSDGGPADAGDGGV